MYSALPSRTNLNMEAVVEGIKAIGFDLFNTLVTVEPSTLAMALESMIESLRAQGLDVPGSSFRESYRRQALRFLEATRQDGRETHNRFWIAAALQELGHLVHPNDPRIEEAVQVYFGAFSGKCHLLPGTLETLQRLKCKYRLGLLSNFTHAPAARKLLEEVGLRPFFQTVLISGDLGYRKPHPWVFQKLLEDLGVASEELLYVGDDPGPDICGSLQAGIRPVWTIYAQEMGVRHVADLAYEGLSPPDGQVPRISSWEELLVLLGMD